MKKFINFMLMIMFAAGFTACIDDPERGALRDGEIHTPWNSVDILVGKSVQIKASLGNETFQWKSENPSIATVSQDGIVEGINLGSTKIIVSTGGSSKAVIINVRGRTISQVIQFGNGTMVRYGNDKSDVLVREDLSYKDHLGDIRTVSVTSDVDSVFLPACRSDLASTSVYLVGTDTIRSEAIPFAVTKNVAKTARLMNTSEILAREFDLGTDTWYDLDALNRLGGTHRDELGNPGCGVDITPTGVVVASPGEWLQYTVMAEDGYYYFDLELAVDDIAGADVAIEIDGDTTNANFHIDKTTTGSEIISYVWYYDDIKLGRCPEFFLAKGPHVIKIHFMSGEISLRKFCFKTKNKAIVEAGLRLDSIYIHDARLFDIGGEGVAYHDATANNTNGNYDFRNALGDPFCGVDIEGDNIGGTDAGEWLRYTLNVAEDCDFYLDFDISVAGSRNKYPISIQIDRDPKVIYNLRCNSSWNDYSYTFANGAIEGYPKLHLTAGQHRMKLTFEEGDGCNLKKIKFIPAHMFEQKGVRLVTRFGNTTVVRWYDCWHFPYSITYTDVNNQQKTMDVPMDTPLGNLLLNDFKSGLSYINKDGGARVDFPDDQITDIRHPVIANVPCIINAVEFDYGGENGVANYDIDLQNRGDNRTYRLALGDPICSVDLGGSTLGTDLRIGWINVNEWMEYTVDVEVEGAYDFDVRVGGNNNTTYSLRINDTIPTIQYWLASTSGYQWMSEAAPGVKRPLIYLYQGKNKIRYTYRQGGADLVQIRLRYSGADIPVDPPEGFDKVTIFGNNVVVVTFKDNAVKYYTLKYRNTSGVMVTKTVSREVTSVELTDYQSDMSATAAGFPTVFTPNAIKNLRYTISATSPIIIPIVDFDYGGEGIGYHDNPGRNGGSADYRTGMGDMLGVDVEIEGSGEPTNMNTGYTDAGEWFQYTIHAEADGDYAFDFNNSVNNNNATFSLTVNGVATQDYGLGHHNTGGWSNYYWFYRHWNETRPVIHLNAGANVFRINIVSGGYNNKSFRLDHVDHLPYPTTGWTAAARNGNHDWGGSGGQADKVLDGDQRTGWHSKLDVPLPHCLVVDMKESKAVDHICLLYMTNGITANKWVYLKNIKVYLTDTPDVVPDVEQASWGAPVGAKEIDLYSDSNKGKDSGSEVTRIDLAAGSSGRYLILYFPDSHQEDAAYPDRGHVSFMELEVYEH